MKTLTKTTKVSASQLAPDFNNLPGELELTEHTFWLGVTAGCPRGQIDVAGLHFPKAEEQIVINAAGKQVRVPVIGAINKTVTRLNFEELVKVLSRLVIRPSKPVLQDASGLNIGDPIERAKGRLIKIPDEKMIAGATASGRRLEPYIKQPGDRPASEFMFFIHAPSGKRGVEYQTIAEVGLEWPEEIKAVEDLLS